MSRSTEPNPPGMLRLLWRRFRRLLMILAVVAIAAWVVHPTVLGWFLRKMLIRAADKEGYSLRIESLHANLIRPFVLENIRLRASDPLHNLTAFDAKRIEVSLSGPATLLSKEGRIFQGVVVTEGNGVIDAREPESPVPVPPAGNGKKSDPSGILRFLPLAIEASGLDVEVVGTNQKTTIHQALFRLSESRLDRLAIENVEVHADEFHQVFGPLVAVTAWKDGTVYLADLALKQDVLVNNLSVALASAQGTAVGFDLQAFGGALRGNVTFAADSSHPALDAAASASNISLEPLRDFLGLHGHASGVLREGRFTFRGDPAKATEAEASLRISAKDFQWNKHGWESLVVGASLINKHLSVSDFHLKQKENILDFNGEVSLAEGWEGLKRSPFLLNVSGSIKDLGELAGLVGPPFDEMTGRMSLRGSVNGSADKMDGYLSVEASDVEFRSLPMNAARLEAVFRNNEVEIAKCEAWSGKDFLKAKGVVELAGPHRYSGEMDLSLKDIASYMTPFKAPGAESIYSGSLALRWQGDGTASSHSGAFNASLTDLVTEATPAGLTGRFEGTYSPQNVYFRNLEFSRGPLRFASQATLAASGLTLKQATLETGGRTLLNAEAFVPLDAFALAAGKPWREAIHPEREIYAQVSSSREINLRELLQLAGQDSQGDGRVKLSLTARGLAEDLKVSGRLTGEGLTMAWEDFHLPSSNLDISVDTASGAASLLGELRTKGFSPVKIHAAMPFGFVKDSAGVLQIVNPTGTISGQLEFPRTDLSLLRPFLPPVRKISGTLSGSIAFSNTVSDPHFEGGLTLQRGFLEASTRTPPLGNLDASLRFDTRRINIERLRGEIGAGPFDITGAVSLEDPSNPSYNLTFIGKKILLARDASLRLRANVRLRAQGDAKEGSLEGAVRFVDGRIYRRIEITPLLVPTPADESPIMLAPQFSNIPRAFAGWKLNVRVDNETPFLIVGNIASGQVIPDLRLQGTLGNPVPVGSIKFLDARAYLPFTTMTISEGRLDFNESSPWMPVLNFRGSADILDYDVQAMAYGPLNDRRLILRSDPPLPQESLVLLLTTGIAPGVNSGSGFGEAAAGQGGFLLLRALVRQFETKGVDLDSFANRLQVQTLPPQSHSEAATLRGRFRFTDNFSFMTERDGYGFYNAGVTYSLRFK